MNEINNLMLALLLVFFFIFFILVYFLFQIMVKSKVHISPLFSLNVKTSEFGFFVSINRDRQEILWHVLLIQ
jgi:hypothetical protein